MLSLSVSTKHPVPEKAVPSLPESHKVVPVKVAEVLT